MDQLAMMDLNFGQLRTEQLTDHLLQIAQLLTCPLCDKLFSNPVGLQVCNHRSCERCAIQRVKKEIISCHVCEKQSSSNNFRNQTQLNMYIQDFRKMIDIFNKNLKSKNGKISLLQDFVYSGKKYSELVNSKENVNSDLNVPERIQDCIDGSLNNTSFVPKFFSTSVKNKRTKTNFIAVNESVVLSDRMNIVEETVDQTIITNDMTMRKHVDETMEDEEHMLTAIENKVLFQNSGSESIFEDEESTMIDDSQELPNNEDNLSDVSPMTLDQIDDNQDLRNIDSYQTQSQYHLKKQSITYAHRTEDKFDRIIKNSDKNIADLNESAKKNDLEDNSRKSNFRCQSPELFMSEFGSEDSLLYSQFPN